MIMQVCEFDFLRLTALGYEAICVSCTTAEKKIGLLLIEVFSKVFNPQNQVHLINVGWPFDVMQTEPFCFHNIADRLTMC